MRMFIKSSEHYGATILIAKSNKSTYIYAYYENWKKSEYTRAYYTYITLGKFNNNNNNNNNTYKTGK